MKVESTLIECNLLSFVLETVDTNACSSARKLFHVQLPQRELSPPSSRRKYRCDREPRFGGSADDGHFLLQSA